MPDTKTEILPITSRSVSYPDLIRASVDELIKFMRENEYTPDLVTIPSRRLSERKDMQMPPGLANDIMVSVAFYLMNTVMTYRKQAGTGVTIGMDLVQNNLEEKLETAIPKLEFMLKRNEWLSRCVDAYLQSRA